MRKRYTDKERSELVVLVTTGRATVPEAAARQGVALSTAYKWMRDRASVRGAGTRPSVRSSGGPSFVRVLPSREAGAAIAVRVGGAEIQIRHGFEAELLRAVIEALHGGGA